MHEGIMSCSEGNNCYTAHPNVWHTSISCFDFIRIKLKTIKLDFKEEKNVRVESDKSLY